MKDGTTNAKRPVKKNAAIANVLLDETMMPTKAVAAMATQHMPTTRSLRLRLL